MEIDWSKFSVAKGGYEKKPVLPHGEILEKHCRVSQGYNGCPAPPLTFLLFCVIPSLSLKTGGQLTRSLPGYQVIDDAGKLGFHVGDPFVKEKEVRKSSSVFLSDPIPVPMKLELKIPHKEY